MARDGAADHDGGTGTHDALSDSTGSGRCGADADGGVGWLRRLRPCRHTVGDPAASRAAVGEPAASRAAGESTAGASPAGAFRIPGISAVFGEGDQDARGHTRWPGVRRGEARDGAAIVPCARQHGVPSCKLGCRAGHCNRSGLIARVGYARAHGRRRRPGHRPAAQDRGAVASARPCLTACARGPTPGHPDALAAALPGRLAILGRPTARPDRGDRTAGHGRRPGGRTTGVLTRDRRHAGSCRARGTGSTAATGGGGPTGPSRRTGRTRLCGPASAVSAESGGDPMTSRVRCQLACRLAPHRSAGTIPGAQTLVGHSPCKYGQICVGWRSPRAGRTPLHRGIILRRGRRV